jgi:hypothetical protein
LDGSLNLQKGPAFANGLGTGGRKKRKILLAQPTKIGLKILTYLSWNFQVAGDFLLQSKNIRFH